MFRGDSKLTAYSAKIDASLRITRCIGATFRTSVFHVYHACVLQSQRPKYIRVKKLPEPALFITTALQSFALLPFFWIKIMASQDPDFPVLPQGDVNRALRTAWLQRSQQSRSGEPGSQAQASNLRLSSPANRCPLPVDVWERWYVSITIGRTADQRDIMAWRTRQAHLELQGLQDPIDYSAWRMIKGALEQQTSARASNFQQAEHQPGIRRPFEQNSQDANSQGSEMPMFSRPNVPSQSLNPSYTIQPNNFHAQAPRPSLVTRPVATNWTLPPEPEQRPFFPSNSDALQAQQQAWRDALLGSPGTSPENERANAQHQQARRDALFRSPGTSPENDRVDRQRQRARRGPLLRSPETSPDNERVNGQYQQTSEASLQNNQPSTLPRAPRNDDSLLRQVVRREHARKSSGLGVTLDSTPESQFRSSDQPEPPATAAATTTSFETEESIGPLLLSDLDRIRRRVEGNRLATEILSFIPRADERRRRNERAAAGSPPEIALSPEEGEMGGDEEDEEEDWESSPEPSPTGPQRYIPPMKRDGTKPWLNTNWRETRGDNN